MSCCEILYQPLEGSEVRFKISSYRAVRRQVSDTMCNFYGISCGEYYRYKQHKGIPSRDTSLGENVGETAGNLFTVIRIFLIATSSHNSQTGNGLPIFPISRQRRGFNTAHKHTLP